MSSKLDKNNVEALTDLAPLQEGMLFEHMIDPKQHQVIFHYKLKGSLNAEILEKALAYIAQKNEVLRTIFRWENIERPVQIILKSHHIPFHFIDISDEQNSGIIADKVSNLEEQLRSQIDLRSQPFQVGLLKSKDKEWHMIIAFHHILMDGWSNMIFMEQWLGCYQHLLQTNQFPPVQEKVKYSQFVEALRKKDADKEKWYWENYLKGHIRTSLSKKLSYNEAIFSKKKFLLGEEATKALMGMVNSQHSTLAMAIYTAWGILLQTYNSSNDVVFGVTVSGRNIGIGKMEEALGLFINTIPFRFNVDKEQAISKVLRQCSYQFREGMEYEHAPLTKIHEYAGIGKLDRLFETLVIIENYPINRAAIEDRYHISIVDYEVHETTPFDITLSVTPQNNNLEFNFSYNTSLFTEEYIDRLTNHFLHILNQVVKEPEMHIEEVELMTIEELNQYVHSYGEVDPNTRNSQTIDQMFESITLQFPDEIALVYKDKILTYKELNQYADSFTWFLTSKLNISKDDRIGVCLPRSEELLIAIIGILKAGAAYVPIDPSLPEERMKYMVENSEMIALVVDSVQEEPESLTRLLSVEEWKSSHNQTTKLNKIHDLNSLAYVIYTSGSTGKPKGVMVEHRNVVSFFEGLNQFIKPSFKDAILSVTTISFDISVLELLWTLCNGMQVVPKEDDQEKLDNYDTFLHQSNELDFSLFFFSNYEDSESNPSPYKLLLESAIFADEHDFSAIWTPERHFHEFGGLYANPAITSAAIAAVTKQIQIRAGSVVSPLHDSLRIAEEWAMVDNLSNGRAGISFASGWHADDFSLAPEHFQDKNEIMYKQIEEVKTLWAGGEIERKNGLGKNTYLHTYPRPIQKEIPIWVTVAGNPKSFEKAGQIGAYVLTHLLGQDIESLKSNIQIYKDSLRKNGFSPSEGKVALMLHTYLGDNIDEVKEVVKAPFCNYLRSSAGLVQKLIDNLNEEIDLKSNDDIFDIAFERYWNKAALFGTVESCNELVDQLAAIGVNDIACLIDFGLDQLKVREGLEQLNQLRAVSVQKREKLQSYYNTLKPITMFQTTPSRLKHIVDDTASQQFLKSLQTIIVGGEAFPNELLDRLKKSTSAKIINAYGPTETTIWSALLEVTEGNSVIPIGKPLKDESIYIVDENLNPLPPNIPGEIVIGGSGVVRGYLNKKELTEVKFIELPKHLSNKGKFFRTGDLGSMRADRTIEFLGRKDYQVKIQGHRIELEEIEIAIRGIDGVIRTVIFDHQHTDLDNKILVALVVAEPNIKREQIREALLQRLPRYMVPQSIVLVDHIPLNASGKIDRNAARLIDLDKWKDEERVIPPRNEDEAQIAEVWEQVLGKSEISISDDFFSLGGDSIKAMRAVALLNKKGINTEVKDIFERPTIKSLVENKRPIAPSLNEDDKEKNEQAQAKKRRSNYRYNNLTSQQVEQVQEVILQKKSLGDHHE